MSLDFITLPQDGNGHAIQAMRPIASQSVAIGGTSAQSTAMDSDVVRVCSTVDCFIEIGANPTAVAGTSMFLPLGMPEYIHINRNDKVAVIQATTGGSLYITRMR